MTEFQSSSQAGQDRFAWEMCDRRPDGYFLDVGCNVPIFHSNSYALEQLGWRGLLVDNQVIPGLAARQSEFVICDATIADWPRLIQLYLPRLSAVDYLSLDCDENTTAALEKIAELPIRFRVITIETDAYLRGDSFKERQRAILIGQGYDLVCNDVCIEAGPWGPGGPFEDWYVMPTPTNLEKRNKYRSRGRHWRDIFQ